MRIQPTTLIQNWINSKKALKNDHIRIKNYEILFSPDQDNMHTDIHYNKTLTTIATIHYPTSRIITIMQNYINTGRDCLDVQKSFKHEGLSN